MTRQAGFVPVVLSRTRAVAIADWLETIEVDFSEATILGSAGLSQAQVQAGTDEKRKLVGKLCACLRPMRRGRPRAGVSRFMVPKAALHLIDRRFYTDKAPRQLRPAILRLVAAAKVRKGPKLSRYFRDASIRRGDYPPETVRHYNWRDRKAQASAALERAAIKSAGPISRDAMAALYPLLPASR